MNSESDKLEILKKFMPAFKVLFKIIPFVKDAIEIKDIVVGIYQGSPEDHIKYGIYNIIQGLEIINNKLNTIGDSHILVAKEQLSYAYNLLIKINNNESIVDNYTIQEYRSAIRTAQIEFSHGKSRSSEIKKRAECSLYNAYCFSVLEDEELTYANLHDFFAIGLGTMYESNSSNHIDSIYLNFLNEFQKRGIRAFNEDNFEDAMFYTRIYLYGIEKHIEPYSPTPSLKSSICCIVGVCYNNMEKFDESLFFYKKALDSQKKADPDNHSMISQITEAIDIVEAVKYENKPIWKRIDKSYRLYVDGKAISGDTINDWVDNNLLVYHPKSKKYYLLEKFYDNLENQFKTAQIVDTGNGTLWRNTPDLTSIFVDGERITGKDENKYISIGDDFLAYHSPSKSYYLLEDFENRRDNQLRPAQLIESNNGALWIHFGTRFSLYLEGEKITGKGETKQIFRDDDLVVYHSTFKKLLHIRGF